MYKNRAKNAEPRSTRTEKIYAFLISEGYCKSHLEGIRLWPAGLTEVSGAACLSVLSLCLIQRATFQFCMFRQ